MEAERTELVELPSLNLCFPSGGGSYISSGRRHSSSAPFLLLVALAPPLLWLGNTRAKRAAVGSGPEGEVAGALQAASFGGTFCLADASQDPMLAYWIACR